MDRREFCRVLGACAACAACTGMAGCARLLDSDRQASKDVSMSTPSEDGALSSEQPTLAVFTGDDPGANVRAAVDALGGMGAFVKKDGLVVVKPNVLTGRPPEYATATNPIAIAAIVTMCLEAGAREVVVLDRPTTEPRQAFETAGLTAAVEQAGGAVKFLSDRNFEQVTIPQGRILRAWPLVTDVFEADTFINVPIAKTHGMAGLTMAMKNLMGIMGGERGTIHQDFAQKIVDVNTLVKPHLVILDAYRMMVRNGPTGGSLDDVRLAKTAVAGTSQVAVDAFGATLFDWKPEQLEYLKVAEERGLGAIDVDTFSIVRGTA